MNKLSKSQLLIFGIILFTFISGAVYSWSMGSDFRYYDEWDYYRIAKNIVEKGIYSTNGQSFTAFRPPGYPFLLAIFIYCGFSVAMLKMVNYAALCLGMWLMTLMLRKYSMMAAIVGLVLVWCYPVLFYTASTLYPQTIAGLSICSLYTYYFLVLLLLLFV